ncbi:MAG: hypothetical protein WC802_05790 [Patescibacteria group bacterium]|jgi:hypothetical protein
MTVSEVQGPKALPSVGNLIQDTFAFLSVNGALVYGYAGWLLVPILVILGASRLDKGVSDVITAIGSVALFALSLWASAAVTLAVTELKRPDLYPKDIKASISELAWRRAPTILWIGLLTGILEGFGLLLLIVPGILFIVWFAFAETEAILTGSGTFLSLEQSRERVRGQFFPVLLRLVVFSLILCLAVTVILVPVMAGAGLTDYTVIFTNPPAWLDATVNALQILIMPAIICYELHLYFALRTP